MGDDFIQVGPDSTGKKVDNTTVTTGAGSVERQRVSIGDAAANNSATVSAEGALKVDGSAVTQPVSGTFFQATQPISDAGGSLTVDQATGSNLHVVVDTAPSTAVTNAGLTNLDVALSTRTKPADQQHTIVDSGALTANQGGAPWSENITQIGGAALSLGQKTGANSIPVVINSDTDRGQDVMANSLPVVIASDQSSVAVTGDVDHDAVDTARVVQVGGYASPVDVPPTAVSAAGDRSRIWVDRFGAMIMRRRKIRETYTAIFRLGEAAARLDQTFTHTANTNKQWATLHHTVAASTKEVRLQLCIAWITSAITVAPQGIIELRQISAAPATGNPAITPTPRRRGGSAAEAIALYLPTTAGTEANVNSPLGHHVFDEAVSVATTAFAHPQGFQRGGIVLFDASQEDDEAMQPVLPVGTLDGWAIVTRLTGATVMRLTAMMVFTEEIP